MTRRFEALLAAKARKIGPPGGQPMTQATEQTTLVRPRVFRALGVGLRAAYDYMGTVLIASALWFGLAALLGAGGSGLLGLAAGKRSPGALLLAGLGGAAAAGIGTGPLTAALFHHVRRLLIHDDPRWWELLSAVPRLWRRGLDLAALQVLVLIVLAVDAFYFLGQSSLLLRVVGVAFLYPLLFWCGAALLQWPLAAERPGDPVTLIVKKSLLLLLDNLGYLVAVTTAVLALSALCFATRIGLTLAWAGVLAFVQTAALRELLPKYGLLAPESSTNIDARP